MSLQDQSQLFAITTPVDAPLWFNNDGYYRLMAKVRCKSCGKPHVAVIRCHRYRVGGLTLPVRRPDPHDDRVMASFFVSVHNHAVGVKRFHRKGCPVAAMPRSRHALGGMGRS